MCWFRVRMVSTPVSSVIVLEFDEDARVYASSLDDRYQSIRECELERVDVKHSRAPTKAVVEMNVDSGDAGEGGDGIGSRWPDLEAAETQ